MHGAAGAADPLRLALGWYDGFHICSVMTKPIQSTVVDIFATFGVLAFWKAEDGLMFRHTVRGRLLRRRLEVDSEYVREFLTKFQRRSQRKS